MKYAEKIMSRRWYVQGYSLVAAFALAGVLGAIAIPGILGVLFALAMGWFTGGTLWTLHEEGWWR